MKDFDTEFKKIQEEYYTKPKDELLSKILEPDTKIVIFGAGAVGNSICNSLNNLGGNVVAFCDNYKTGINEQYKLPIITPAELLSSYKSAIIVVAVDYKYNNDIYNQVLGLGIPKDNIFRRYSGYELYDIERMKVHYKGYKWAYNFFEDELSKRIILERIRSYLFFHEMEHSPPCKQYFDDEVIEFSDNEVFVDGGSYTGDTVLEFIKYTSGNYEHIYGFEPEINNFKQAKINLTKYKNIDLINKGLWSNNDTLSFNSANSSSKIDDSGKNQIELISLDSFFREKSNCELPTFIKLDIEGAEKQALIGMSEIIKKAHPKLAVCVYHKPEDVYELPQIISKLGDYKLSLRHYSCGSIETVLYSI
jgi:FkbM family methyltransferase